MATEVEGVESVVKRVHGRVEWLVSELAVKPKVSEMKVENEMKLS